jgi:hypothetical protein
MKPYINQAVFWSMAFRNFDYQKRFWIMKSVFWKKWVFKLKPAMLSD